MPLDSACPETNKKHVFGGKKWTQNFDFQKKTRVFGVFLKILKILFFFLKKQKNANLEVIYKKTVSIARPTFKSGLERSTLRSGARVQS